MKKTISIHLQGFPFLIEEDAYQKLSDYIQKLQVVLKNADGANEIIQDVELRMAELFSKQLENGKKVIELSGVEAVIAVLGNPEVFADAEQSETFSTDSAEREIPVEKRLFRDEDNATIGGVASGFANYFGIDVVIIRALFVLAVFVGGFGVPLYIILWVITPKAKTSFEKLQMKGKPVTLESMKEEIEKASEKIQQKTSSWAKAVEKDGNIGTGIRRLVRAFSIAFGLFCLFLGSMLLFSSVMVLFVDPNWIPAQINGEFMSLGKFGELIVENEWDFELLYSGLILMAFSIISFLYMAGIRALYPMKNYITRTVSIASVAAGIISTVILSYSGVNIARSYAVEGEVQKDILTSDSTQLNLNIIKEERVDKEGFKVVKDDHYGAMQINGKNIEQFGVRVDYETSPDSLFHVQQIFQAEGRNWSKAQERARSIKATILVEGNNIFLPVMYTFPVADKLRDQEWKLKVQVPRDKKVFFSGRQVYPYLITNEENRESTNGYINEKGEYESW
jgi:phage shock protein PspC (stress-responsive transcriptional regulator)